MHWTAINANVGFTDCAVLAKSGITYTQYRGIMDNLRHGGTFSWICQSCTADVCRVAFAADNDGDNCDNCGVNLDVSTTDIGVPALKSICSLGHSNTAIQLISLIHEQMQCLISVHLDIPCYPVPSWCTFFCNVQNVFVCTSAVGAVQLSNFCE